MINSMPSATASRPPAVRHGLAVAGAVLAAVMVRLIAAATGTTLRVTPPGQSMLTVSLPMVVTIALAASLAGWAALVVLRRITRRAHTVWTGLAVVALLASLVPLSSVQTTASARVFLALMHIAVAAVLIPGLRAAAPTTDTG
jgi:membrane-associated HD superfamily phosphohydrolase